MLNDRLFHKLLCPRYLGRRYTRHRLQQYKRELAQDIEEVKQDVRALETIYKAVCAAIVERDRYDE